MTAAKKRPCRMYQTDASIAPDTAAKRRRRCISIGDKVELLERIRSGERLADLSRACGVSESALRALQRSGDQVRDYAAQCNGATCRTVSYLPRNWLVERAEQALYRWYKAERHDGHNLTITAICAKMRALYKALKESEAADRQVNGVHADSGNESRPLEQDFKGSKGWFRKFRRRYNLDVRTIGAKAEPDVEAAHEFTARFKQLVAGGDYSPQQVFTVTELPFAWRALPARSTIAPNEQSARRIGQERTGLLFCGNACGDFTVKPLLVYRTFAPFSIRARNFNELPVLWRARPRYTQACPRVSAAHFHDWLTECFVPSVRDYLHIMELPQRCMLLMDADLWALVPRLATTYDRHFVRMQSLPKNTTPLLQPLVSSVLPLFRCNYFRRMLEYFVSRKGHYKLYGMWRSYTISEAIDIMDEALQKIDADCWNAGWQHLWPEIVRQPLNPSTQFELEIQRIIEVGHRFPDIGFRDMCVDDIKRLLKLDTDPRTLHPLENTTPYDDAEILAEVDENDDDDITIQAENEEEEEEEAEQEEQQKEGDDDAHYEDIKRDLLAIMPDDSFTDFYTHTPSDSDNNEDEIHDDDDNTNERNATESSAQHKQQQCQPVEQTRQQDALTAQDKVRTINKALALAGELSALLGVVAPQREDHRQFTANLAAIMAPYKHLKAQLLQPSIRDYFKERDSR